MKIKELIEKLQELDPELPVLVQGYEGGCDDLGMGYIEVIGVMPNANKQWCCGHHKVPKDKGEYNGVLLG